ncbi:amidohydrolase family protein [Wenzhouxiangella sp. AB-CW3]|nr:amidohydrolase family protein [Wenzhouxiangella sp. AB-CW3]
MIIVLSLAVFSAGLAAQNLVVVADTLHVGNGERHAPGVVVIEDGRVAAVGPADSVSIPEGMERIEVPVATPGLIDGRSVVGLAGAKNQPHDQDQLERSDAMQPELRAIDAYNPRERLVGWLREHGITTVHTGHGPGEIISGQTLIAKTTGGTVDAAVVEPVFALSATLGDASTRGHSRSSPGSRSKSVAMLRQQLIRADEYKAARDNGETSSNGPRDLGLEALVDVLDGKLPLVVEVHRHNDIMTALRLAEEFGFRLILAGASDAHLLIDEISEAGVPVLIHPTMMRGRGPEYQNFSFTTAARLLDAGIPVALQSGYEGYVPKTRVVLFEAAMTLPYGASFDQALHLITMGPAEILGIADRVGSLEPGKDGDVALFDGDPFEYTTRVLGTVINGVRVSEVAR